MRWCDDYSPQISHLAWERIFFEFQLNIPENLISSGFSLALTNDTKAITAGQNIGSPAIFIDYESKSENTFFYSINMAAVSHRSFLENGNWRFCVVSGECAYPVSIAFDDAHRADELSRVFKYGKNQYAYNVSFEVKEIPHNRIELILCSYFLRINAQWKKRKYVQEALTLKGKFKRFYMWLVILLIRGFYFIFSRILPKNGSRILFMTETKDYLWGNLKYIHDRIIERGLSSRFKITCSCRKSVGHKKSILSWIKTVYNIAASDYIFIDDYAPVFGFFKLYEKTCLIQVWHAGEGFKSVGYSRFGKDGSPFPSGSCHKAYTWALTGAPNLIKVYEEVFGIEKSAFLPLGMARLDHFLDQTYIDTFKDKFFAQYPDLKNKRVILFAPTFRGTGQKEAWYDYRALDFKQIYDFCGNDTIFMIKMHPFIKEKPPIPADYTHRIVDLSSWPDINELFYITDILITDYSSNYYEYALLRRPILFYTYDREFYELTRGVHRSVKESAPGKVCDCFDELITALKTEDYEFDKTIRFADDNFKFYDGQASDRIINKILLNEGEVNE